MKYINICLENEHYDELTKYYNEHHSEIRAKGYRNFYHWIGGLSYKGFQLSILMEKEVKEIKKNE